MKYLPVIPFLLLAIFASGCAREAVCIDREYGLANRDAFDKQIVHKDYKYAGQPVEGVDGIYVEHTMSKYLETFNQGFTKEDVDISATGID